MAYQLGTFSHTPKGEEGLTNGIQYSLVHLEYITALTE